MPFARRAFSGMLVAALFSVSIGAQLHAASAPAQDRRPPYRPGEILVKFAHGTTAADAEAVRRDLGATRLDRLPLIGASHERIKKYSVEEAVARYRGDPRIEYIEPDYLYYPCVAPDDALFSQQWNMCNTGQGGGKIGVDIHATQAWDLCTGSPDVLVGMVDSGIWYDHPDLAANIWTNPGEIPGNGIDDDSNGFVDDVHGYDFVSDDGDPVDEDRDSHGTHTAGTVGAVGNNQRGVAGVAWRVKLLPIRVFNLSSGPGATSTTLIKALAYAVSMGARITSNSYSGRSYQQAFHDAIKAAGDRGVLFVVAAGNESENIDYNPRYPASYGLPNIISVEASDATDQLAVWSNYGPGTVHLAAPGQDILSTLRGVYYGLRSGTSMATPHVTGALALVLSRFPGITPAAAKAQLLEGVDWVQWLSGVSSTGGRLNAYKPLVARDSTAPGGVTDLAVSHVGSARADLQWTASGDDGAVGTATRYDVRYATAPITDESFATASQVPGIQAPFPAGSSERLSVRGLLSSTTYYFALKTCDELGNASPISNVATATTLPPPAVAVAPDSLSADLLSGQTATRSLTLSNAGSGELVYAIEVRPLLPGGPAAAFAVVSPPRSATIERQGGEGLPGPHGPSGSSRLLDYRLSRVAASSEVFYDDMEQGDNGWTHVSYVGGDLWHRTTRASNSPVTSWWCGVEEKGIYGTIGRVATAAVSPTIDLGGLRPPVTLEFYENFLTEPGHDFCMVDVSADHGATWTPLRGGPGQAPSGSSGGWRLSILDLSAWAGESVKLRFYLDTVDGAANDYPGWYFDDVLVTGNAVPWIGVAPDSGTVAAGDERALTVTFDAAGVPGGDYQAQIRLTSNDPTRPAVTVPATLHVTGAPAIAVSKSSLDFGEVSVGLVRRDSVRVSNVGSEALRIGGVTVAPAQFTTALDTFELAPGGTRTLTVTFTPTTPGSVIGSLEIASNDAEHGTSVIALSGVGRPAAHIEVHPAQFDTSLVTPAASVTYLNLSNGGSADLEFAVTLQASSQGPGQASGSETAAPSWLSVTPAGGTVPVSGTLPLSVNLATSGVSAGRHDASIRISSNDPVAPLVSVPVSLHVIGVPDIAAAPASLDFGWILPGESRQTSLEVHNVGNWALNVSSVTHANPAFVAEPGGFSLAVGSVRQLVVTFAPQVPGEFADTLIFHCDDPDSPDYAVPLHGGMGDAPAVSVSPSSFESYVKIGDVFCDSLEIGNGGDAPLNWHIEVAPSMDQTVAARIPTVTRGAPAGAEGTVPRTRAASVESVGLADALARLEQRYGEITSLLPSRYNFTEGVTGDSIADGGIDMYDGGNFLQTDRGGPVPYSDRALGSSTAFGTSGGNYFTAKFPGLFVLAADLEDVASFTVSGNLGVDGFGSVDAATLEATVAGVLYRGYVKRVYGWGNPYVNHLIVVPDSGVTAHQFATNTDDDFDRVTGLGSCPHLYYMLWSSLDMYTNDAQCLQLMTRLLAIVASGPAWLTASPASGLTSGRDSVRVALRFNPSGLQVGFYDALLVVHSNDPVHPEVTIPVRMYVDQLEPVELALVSATVEDGMAKLVWYSAADGAISATVYRRTTTSDWSPVRSVASDGQGFLRFEDRDLPDGQRLGYRLGVVEREVECFYGETWVEAPARAVFALDGLLQNPVVGDFRVAFSLPDRRPATLEVLDIGGRRLLSMEVGTLGPGRHVLDLENPFAPGLYFVRLSRAGHALTVRAAVLR